MRLTPAQIGMHALLGEFLPMAMPRDQGRADRIRDGRQFLARVSRADLGYDPRAWHAHLCETDAGGYRWSNIHLGFPRRIAESLANPEWQRAVASLEGRTLDSSWRTADALGLALAIREERALDRLPLLGDALRDAGCDDDAMLTHCRLPKLVRGRSWVVDLLLGADNAVEPRGAPDAGRDSG